MTYLEQCRAAAIKDAEAERDAGCTTAQLDYQRRVTHVRKSMEDMLDDALEAALRDYLYETTPVMQKFNAKIAEIERFYANND